MSAVETGAPLLQTGVPAAGRTGQLITTFTREQVGLHMLVPELALHAEFENPEVMRDQVRKLIDATQAQNVETGSARRARRLGGNRFGEDSSGPVRPSVPGSPFPHRQRCRDHDGGMNHEEG